MIKNLIIETVNSTGKFDVVNEETILHGDGSPLDSLSFVKLMVDVNVAITKKVGSSVDVFKPEYFLGKKYNPYRTVGSFIRLVNSLVVVNTVDSVMPSCKPVKIIFTDLDGTLWDGISGEGETAWKMNIIYELSRLNECGILVVLVTKNYEEIVSSYVKGIEQDIDFVCKHYNAFDKAAAIRDTCKRLNISLDSAVFLDDSEHERDYVRSTLPEVRVYDNHMDIANITVEHVTDEDRRRTEMYRQEFARESSKPHSDSSYDYMAWLNSLNMVMTVKNATEENEVIRAEELVNRCNQFRFNNTKYNCELNTLIFSLKDKFGDMGVIGVAQIKDISNASCVVQLCVSCRVLGRYVEDAICRWINNFCKIEIISPVDTGKNKAALDFWIREKILTPFIKIVDKT